MTAGMGNKDVPGGWAGTPHRPGAPGAHSTGGTYVAWLQEGTNKIHPLSTKKK